MMCAPIFAGVEPVNDDSEDSDTLAVTPAMPHSSNGAACHLTMPPNPLNERLSRADVVVAERCGDVPAKLNVSVPVAPAWPSVCIGPSLFGAASAVNVAPSVESRANIMIIGALAEPCPPISISCTSRPDVALVAPIAMNVLFANAVVSAVAAGDHTGAWKTRFPMCTSYGVSIGGVPRG